VLEADPADVLDSPGAGSTAIRGSAIRVVGYGVGLLLSLASATLLIRHLGVAAFGRYVTAVSVISISVALLEGGVTWMAIQQYSVLRGEERERHMRDLLGLRLLLTVLAALAAMAWGLAAGYDHVLLAATAVAVAAGSIQALQPVMSTALQVQLRWDVLTIIDLAARATRVVLLLALIVVWTRAGLVSVMATLVPAAIVSVVGTVMISREGFPLRPAFNTARWRPLFREQLPFAATVAVGSVYFRMPVLLLELVANPLQTGYYATAFRVMEVLVALPVLVVGTIFPILARAGRDDPKRHAYVVSRALEVALIAGTLLVLVVTLGASPILEVIAGPQGRPSVSVLQIQGIALLAMFVAQTAGFALLAVRAYRALLISGAAALASNIALTLVLGSRYGAHGAAAAALVTEALLAVMMTRGIWSYHHGLKISGRLVAVVPLGAAAGFATLALPVPPVIRVVLAVSVYVMVLGASSALPSELLDFGRSMLEAVAIRHRGRKC
jgi:O-antigen/teichoic acid export membrane protein